MAAPRALALRGFAAGTWMAVIWRKAVAGAILLFTARFLACYPGMVMMMNSSWRRRVLPVFGQPRDAATDRRTGVT